MCMLEEDIAFLMYVMYVCMYVCLSVCVCMYVCMRVCVQISSLKPLGLLKPNFMWNLHGGRKLIQIVYSRSFVVLHYCLPPGAGVF